MIKISIKMRKNSQKINLQKSSYKLNKLLTSKNFETLKALNSSSYLDSTGRDM